MVVFNEIHHLSPIDQKVIGAALSELDEVKTLFFSSLVPYDADCSYYAKHAFMCGEIDLIMDIEKSERPHADTARYSLPSTEEKYGLIRDKRRRKRTQPNSCHSFGAAACFSRIIFE